jgi:transposase
MQFRLAASRAAGHHGPGTVIGAVPPPIKPPGPGSRRHVKRREQARPWESSAPFNTVTVTEHLMIERECPCCGARTKAQAPAGVTAPVQYGPRFSALAAYLWHGQFLSRERACAALGEMPGCAPAPAVIAGAAKKIAAFASPATGAITKALLACEVAHFDETGFRVAGKLAWVHSASSGRYVLHTVHARRGQAAIDPVLLAEQEKYFTSAAETGIVLNAARRGSLEKKRHALANRMRNRAADYLRFAYDLRTPFDNNPAEQAIRMSKLRIKVSGCMRSMTGAETFCVLRSYLATAARHGISALDALTRAAQGDPWIPAIPATA